MTRLLASCSLLLLATFAAPAEKSIPELIRDFAVESKGNSTANTACAIVVKKGDEAVPYLKAALSGTDEKLLNHVVRCLCEIDTPRSRGALIKAYPTATPDWRRRYASYLAFRPNKDAENVYLASLKVDKSYALRAVIGALAEIRSQKALEPITAIHKATDSWLTYYAALLAIRKIEGKELPRDVADALESLKKAKYSASVPDDDQLKRAVDVLNANLDVALPDVCNLIQWQTKGGLSHREPNAETIIRGAGERAYPLIRFAMKDPDHNVNHWFVALVKKLGWEAEFKAEIASAKR
jgi:hypothetical protein